MLEIIRENGDGDWRWHFQDDGNNEIVFGSTEGYERLTGCIHSLKVAAAVFKAPVIAARNVTGGGKAIRITEAEILEVCEPIRAMRLAQTALRSVTDYLETQEQQEIAGEALLALQNVLALYEPADDEVIQGVVETNL